MPISHCRIREQALMTEFQLMVSTWTCKLLLGSNPSRQKQDHAWSCTRLWSVRICQDGNERRSVQAQASPCSAKLGIAATCQSEHRRLESSLWRATSVSNLPGKTAKEAAWPWIHATQSLKAFLKRVAWL